MKVAVFRPRWAINNTAFEIQARMYHYLAETHGLDITVFADAEHQFRYPGLNVIDVARRNKQFISSLLEQLHILPPLSGNEYPDWKLLLGYDLIETSDPTLYRYTTTALRAARAAGTRLTCGSSVTLPKLFATSYKQAKQVMDYAHRISCCTPKAQERFEALGLLEKESRRVIILGHPIDTALFVPAEQKKQNERFRVLSVGRLDREKGHEEILQALAILHAKGYQIEWHVIGKGSRDSLQKLAVDHGLNGKVHFYGSVHNRELPRHYTSADIFVLHQHATDAWEEYFGVVMAEAMSCALPVVATATGGIPYVVHHEITGLLVAPRDIAALTAAIRTFIENPDFRMRAGNAGRKMIEREFALEKVSERCLDLWGYRH